jgi:hypothetical protein
MVTYESILGSELVVVLQLLDPEEEAEKEWVGLDGPNETGVVILGPNVLLTVEADKENLQAYSQCRPSVSHHDS